MTSLDEARVNDVTVDVPEDGKDGQIEKKSTVVVMEEKQQQWIRWTMMQAAKRRETNILIKHVCEKSGQIGLAHLVEKHTFRRLVWLSLIIAFTIFTFIQINQQLQRYTNHPISTSFDMEYEKSIPFPTVSICNTNNIKVSYYYEHVYKYHVKWERDKAAGNTTLTKEEYWYNKTDKIIHSYRDFRVNGAHKLQDMLLRLMRECVWPSGEECGVDDFKEVLTDVGVCYTINHDPTKLKNLTTAGPLDGLWLVLNGEVYDHMSEQTCQSGKQMESNGIYKEILQGGKMPCLHERDQESKYFRSKAYTQGKCVIESFFDEVIGKCKCKPYYLPGYYRAEPSSNDKYCTIKEHYTCASDLMGITKNILDNCPIPCVYEEYSPTVITGDLPHDLISFKSTDDDYKQDLHHYPTRKRRSLTESKRRLEKLQREEAERDPMFRYDYNFSYDAMDDEYRNAKFVSAPSELPARNERDLNDNDNKCSDNRMALKSGTAEYTRFARRRFMGIDARYRVIQQLAVPLKRRMEKFREADQKLRNSSWSPLGGSYFKDLPTRLKENVECYKNISKHYAPFILVDSETIEDNMPDEVPEEFHNTTIGKDVEKLEAATKRALDVIRLLWEGFVPNKVDFVLDDDEVDTYKEILTKLDDYEHSRTGRATWAKEMTADNMTNFWDNAINKKFEIGTYDVFMDYQKGLVAGNTAELKNASARLLESEVDLMLLAIALLNDTDQTEVIYDMIDSITECRFYNLTAAADEWSDEFSDEMSELSQAYSKLLKLHEQFIENFEDRRQIELDNLLTANIYVKDMSIYIMKQDSTYSGWSLMCDIGGSLGLFLGASIIGIVELVWLFFIEPCLGDEQDEQPDFIQEVLAETEVEMKQEEAEKKEEEKERKKEEKEKKKSDEDVTEEMKANSEDGTVKDENSNDKLSAELSTPRSRDSPHSPRSPDSLMSKQSNGTRNGRVKKRNGAGRTDRHLGFRGSEMDFECAETPPAYGTVAEALSLADFHK